MAEPGGAGITLSQEGGSSAILSGALSCFPLAFQWVCGSHSCLQAGMAQTQFSPSLVTGFS